MGLDSVATHIIWLVAVLSILSFGAKTLDVADELREAREEADRLDQARLSTRLVGPTFCYRGGTEELVLNATNVGDASLDLSELTFMLDGTPHFGDVSSWLGSDLWAPGEQLEVTLSGVAAEPSVVVVTTAEGAAIYPTHIVCPILSSIVVTPSSVSMLVGSQQDFSAAGYDQYGNEIPNLAFSWSTTTGSLTTLSPTSVRLSSGTTSGTFTVTATNGAVGGEATVTLTPDAPVSLTVTPETAQVTAGGTQAFTATLLDQYGNVNTTAAPSWSTNAGAISSGGVLTAQTTAQTGRTVTATYGSLSDGASVDVVPGPVDHVTVTPSTATVLAGATQSFSAVAYDQYDNVNSTTITWSATRGAVSTAGLYTAPATRGADTVTATADGVQGTASVTVTQTVHIDALGTYFNGVADAAFLRGETLEVRATVRDHNNNLVEGVTVTVQLLRPNSQLETTLNDATDASGVASASHTLSGTAQKGQWTARVTGISGTNVTYSSAANVVTQVNFQVD